MKNGMSQCVISTRTILKCMGLGIYSCILLLLSEILLIYKIQNSKKQTKNLLQDNIYDNMENVSEISQKKFLSCGEISTTLHLSLKYI